LRQFERSPAISPPARAPRSCCSSGNWSDLPPRPSPSANAARRFERVLAASADPANPQGYHKAQERLLWPGMRTGLHITVEVDFLPLHGCHATSTINCPRCTGKESSAFASGPYFVSSLYTVFSQNSALLCVLLAGGCVLRGLPRHK
jgi:hypothetical protein